MALGDPPPRFIVPGPGYVQMNLDGSMTFGRAEGLRGDTPRGVDDMGAVLRPVHDYEAQILALNEEVARLMADNARLEKAGSDFYRQATDAQRPISVPKGAGFRCDEGHDYARASRDLRRGEPIASADFDFAALQNVGGPLACYCGAHVSDLFRLTLEGDSRAAFDAERARRANLASHGYVVGVDPAEPGEDRTVAVSVTVDGDALAARIFGLMEARAAETGGPLTPAQVKTVASDVLDAWAAASRKSRPVLKALPLTAADLAARVMRMEAVIETPRPASDAWVSFWCHAIETQERAGPTPAIDFNVFLRQRGISAEIGFGPPGTIRFRGLHGRISDLDRADLKKYRPFSAHYEFVDDAPLSKAAPVGIIDPTERDDSLTDEPDAGRLIRDVDEYHRHVETAPRIVLEPDKPEDSRSAILARAFRAPGI